MIPDETPAPGEGEEGAWGRPFPARLGEAVIGLALLASGLFFAYQSYLLDFGGVGLPGPALFPFALGIALSVLSLGILFLVWRGLGAGEVVYLGHRNVLVVVGAMAGLTFAFERVDSYVAMGTFAAVILLLVARSALWQVLLGATLGMIGVWLFFGVALGVRLPTSDFWAEIAQYVSALPPFSLF